MKRVRHLDLLLILGCLSITSIGFSAWITQETTVNSVDSSVNTNVGTVIDVSEYLKIDNEENNQNFPKGQNKDGKDVFNYCKEGFVNKGEVDLRYGSMDFYFILNVAALKNDIFQDKKYDEFKIITTLSYQDNFTPAFDIINKNFLIGAKAFSLTYTLNNATNPSYSTGNYRTSISFNQGSMVATTLGFGTNIFTFNKPTIYIKTSLKFELPDIHYFENTIYPNIKDFQEGFLFKLKIEIGR